MGGVSYCITDLPAHERLNCNETKKGGISAIGFLSTNHEITDFENETQLQAEIDAGRLTIVKSIKGEIPEPSPVEGESLSACGPDTVLDGYDRTANWMDGAVSEENVDFYDSLSQWQGYIIFYTCIEKQLIVEDRTSVSVTAGFTVPNSQKSKQMWKGTAKWNYLKNPVIYDGSVVGPALFE